MKIKKYKLNNGVRAIFVPIKDNPAVTVLVIVEAGSKYENKQTSGLSHFLEHMVFKGTDKRPKPSAIARELDSIGAQYNAFTAQELTGYYAKADSRHFAKILDVVSDIYLNPIFDQAEMTKEKGVIVEEIRMYQDLPQRHVHDLMMEALYGDQPAGYNIAGTEDNVKSFTREMLVDYRSKNYVGSATTVIVSGSFDQKKALVSVKKAFDALPKTQKQDKQKVIENQEQPKIVVQFKETDQTHLVIGCRTFPIADKRTVAVNLLATILGAGMSSRLFSKMRDQLGICYYVNASNNLFTDHGYLSISAGVDNSRVDEAIRELLVECKRLKTQLISSEELKKAKDFTAGTTMLELETSDAQAEFCGFQEATKHKIELPKDIIAKINKVTAKDIQKVANEIFTDEKLNLAIIGRFNDSERFKSYFSLK